MLSWGTIVLTFLRHFYLSGKILFHRKLWFMGAGIIIYYGILYALSVFRPGDGFSSEEALRVLVEAPGTVLAIYLTMDLVASERDRDTLEILFSTATSHYTIWAMRILAVTCVLLISTMTMSMLSYYLFAEFPYIWGGINAFVAAFFIACMTFLFSVHCRSSNAAAMLAVGVLVVVLVTSNALEQTPYFLFMNPLNPPGLVDEAVWFERGIYNRLTVGGLGCLFVFSAFRRMIYREKIL
jgi:ABC-type transport system involved in multi-copper enzyme maturation permease subunit